VRCSDGTTEERSPAASDLECHLGERLGLGAHQLVVEAGGREREIAVLRVPAAALEALLDPEVRSEIVERARAAGFRHAAVDLDLAGAEPAIPEA